MPAHLLPLSRRGFLSGSATTLAALGSSQRLGADSQTNLDCWALLSDTHLLSQTSIQRHYGRNEIAMQKRASLVAANFERVARQVTSLPEKPAGLILNGDCVHVGGEEEYALLARKFRLLEGLPIHLTMGNHDHRPNFLKAFHQQGRRTGRALLENRHVSVLKSRHANLVLMDSLTMQNPDRPVKGPGRIGKEQLEWLASVLDSEKGKPTIAYLHHNIDPSKEAERRFGKSDLIVPSAAPPRARKGGLQDTDALLDMLASRKHVKAVMFGHMHQFHVFKWRGLSFVSLPPVGYTFGPKDPVGWAKLLLRKGGATLEVRALDAKNVHHRKRVQINWS